MARSLPRHCRSSASPERLKGGGGARKRGFLSNVLQIGLIKRSLLYFICLPAPSSPSSCLVRSVMKTEFRSGLLNHGNDGPTNGVRRRCSSSSGFSPHVTVVITDYSVLARLKLAYHLPQRKIVEAIRGGGDSALGGGRIVGTRPKTRDHAVLTETNKNKISGKEVRTTRYLQRKSAWRDKIAQTRREGRTEEKKKGNLSGSWRRGGGRPDSRPFILRASRDKLLAEEDRPHKSPALTFTHTHTHARKGAHTHLHTFVFS